MLVWTRVRIRDFEIFEKFFVHFLAIFFLNWENVRIEKKEKFQFRVINLFASYFELLIYFFAFNNFKIESIYECLCPSAQIYCD